MPHACNSSAVPRTLVMHQRVISDLVRWPLSSGSGMPAAPPLSGIGGRPGERAKMTWLSIWK